MRCENCQKLEDRIAELEELLGIHSIMPRCLKLTRVQEIVLGMLCKNVRVSVFGILQAIYGPQADRHNEILARSYISLLRKKLRPFEIEIINEFGRGWYIKAEGKRKIAAMIESEER